MRTPSAIRAALAVIALASGLLQPGTARAQGGAAALRTAKAFPPR